MPDTPKQPTTFDKYQFNEHGVCINPDVVYCSNDHEHLPAIKIEVCQHEKGWNSAYSIHGQDSAGVGIPCSRVGAFPSKEAAVDYSISVVRFRYKDYFTKGKYPALFQQFEEWSLKQRNQQLKMF